MTQKKILLQNTILLVILLFLLNINCIYSQEGWLLQNSFTHYKLNDIYFVNGSTGYVAGDSAYIFPTNGCLLKTTNGGLNWTKSLFEEGLFRLFFSNTNEGYIVGFSPKLYKTTDAGNSWVIHNQTALFYLSIFFINNFTGFIGGDGGEISKTTNSGLNWNSIILNTDYRIKDIYFVDSLHGFALGSGFYPDAVIYKTTNSGINWLNVFNYSGKRLNSVYFINNNTGYAVGGLYEQSNTGLILKTTNAGINWFNQVEGMNTDFQSIIMVNSELGYTVGGNGLPNGNVVLKTSNGGAIWIRQSTPVDAGFNSVKFFNSETGYIVGSNGIILKTTTGGNVTGINNVNAGIPIQYYISQNYPNPFNPQTNIKFAVPSNVKRETSTVKLIIYDLLGREVATIVNEELKPGIYETDWDGSNYSSGVYFYKLVVDDPSTGSGRGFVETKKMVLMK